VIGELNVCEDKRRVLQRIYNKLGHKNLGSYCFCRQFKLKNCTQNINCDTIGQKALVNTWRKLITFNSFESCDLKLLWLPELNQEYSRVIFDNTHWNVSLLTLRINSHWRITCKNYQTPFILQQQITREVEHQYSVEPNFSSFLF